MRSGPYEAPPPARPPATGPYEDHRRPAAGHHASGYRPGVDSPLALDAPREEVLARASNLIAAAWRSFDRFRPTEPPIDERVRALLATGPSRAPHAVLRRARRRVPDPRRVDRAAEAALLRLHRLLGARDRGPRRRARLLLRRQPRALRGGRVRDRAPGDPLGRRVRRLPGREWHLHERGHRLEPHRPDRGSRARCPRLADDGAGRPAPRRLHVGGGPLLRQARRRDPRPRRRQPSPRAAR